MNIKATLLNQADLTDREAQVLELICEGQPDKLIARSLAISIKTVATHIEHIYNKLDVRGRSINRRCSVIGHAVASGMVRLSSSVLCIWLMIGCFDLNHDAIRTSFARAQPMRITRTKDGSC